MHKLSFYIWMYSNWLLEVKCDFKDPQAYIIIASNQVVILLSRFIVRYLEMEKSNV